MKTTPSPSLPHSQYERFESMRQYEAMLDELIPKTQRVIRVFDKSLTASYNSQARCQLISTFLRSDPLNRLYIVVHDAISGGAYGACTDARRVTCPRSLWCNRIAFE